MRNRRWSLRTGTGCSERWGEARCQNTGSGRRCGKQVEPATVLCCCAQVLDDKSDKTSLSLVYANQTEDDILCREQLEALQSAHPDQFKLWYTVDRPKEGWKYDAGHITADMIQAHLPGPGPDTLVLMCGPPPMVKYACKENLTKLGYASSSMLAF